ncbi:MAG: leucine-rich repeat domain-containing protein [Ruminococcus sp.]|nr:leucine-rich repeat domain-containing protein [Ruminococcus sp.]
MNDNERIENLENEVEKLKVIIKMLKKDAGLLPVKAQTTPEKQPEEFNIENGVLCEYLGNSGEVNIPYGVTRIAKNAFREKKTIKKVNCPDTLTEIGNSSFHNCKSLVVDNFKNVTKIGEKAFYNCKNLHISVPATCEIGNDAFYGCKKVVIRGVNN